MHIYIAPAKYFHRLQVPPVSSCELSEESASFDGLREEQARFLLPENADLAQSLLQIILDRSCLERFSPNGGGAVVIVLEDWQIEILESYDIIFKQGPAISQDKENSIIKANNVAKPEYISLDENRFKSNKKTKSKRSKKEQEESKLDILSEWLGL